PAPPPAALGFPPATLAGNAFSAAATGRGISQTLGHVASDGAEIVAVGSQQGARIARAQFFVSTDDGRTWSMGRVRTPDGGPPPPGYAARFVAGGHGAWVALGPSSIWTSPDGRTWTLSSTAGLPLRPGDQISVVKRTATGFIAAGSAGSTPLVFLSANGITWQRLQPQLSAGTGRVLNIRSATAYGNQILITGDVTVTQTAGKPPHPVTIKTSAAWLSGNGGTTWTLAVPPGNGTPAGHGAQAQISGVTSTGAGFLLFRPATVKRQPAADVYRSANGTAWTFEATLATKAGFTTDMVNGAPAGAVITGQSGPGLIAFVSANGASWRQIPAFGTAATQDVSGVAIAQGGTVVAAGTTTNDPDSHQPLLTVIPGHGSPQSVDIGKIPGAADPELAVNDVAAGNGMQVAVGSANGYPAAWTSANGGTTWTRATGQSPAVLDRPGVQQLTSVAYGADGWLAVGGVIAVAPQHPVVLTSGNGSAWIAADREPAFSQPGLVTEQAAAAATGGYVIVGYQSAGGRTIAAAWYSTGLTGWQRGTVDTPGDTQGAQNGAQQMRAVTA
ncbi:MAG TPA: sialidase family protein, partial [Streptosporangiaceae bacterium]|nr:sialidase family protein [Streptosporangiaceae bacterium]